jgi:hypothetical protein
VIASLENLMERRKDKGKIKKLKEKKRNPSF